MTWSPRNRSEDGDDIDNDNDDDDDHSKENTNVLNSSLDTTSSISTENRPGKHATDMFW